jgi:hypothetical protein
MDRIVVREWKGPSNAETKYVVVEGNRRAAALKWLKDLHHYCPNIRLCGDANVLNGNENQRFSGGLDFT